MTWPWLVYLVGVAGMVFVCLNTFEDAAKKNIRLDANRHFFPIFALILGLMWPGVLLGFAYWVLEDE